MKLSLIAAVATNGVIGRDNTLPWHIREDLQYFKQTTLGKPLLMGRGTYESIGRPLPGRLNIVLSRQPGLRIEGVEVVADVPSALALAQRRGSSVTDGELMVIGGAQIYRLTLPLARRLYLTEVHADIEGDTRFPDWRRADWLELRRQRFNAAGSNPYDYSFVVYERARGDIESGARKE